MGIDEYKSARRAGSAAPTGTQQSATMLRRLFKLLLQGLLH